MTWGVCIWIRVLCWLARCCLRHVRSNPNPNPNPNPRQVLSAAREIVNNEPELHVCILNAGAWLTHPGRMLQVYRIHTHTHTPMRCSSVWGVGQRSEQGQN